MCPQSCKIGLLRHQQRIQNPKRQNLKRVKKIELKKNNAGLEYSRNCAQKSYQKTVQKSVPQKSSSVPLRCVKCDETFKTKFNFDFHLNISQVTSDFEKCKLCHFKSCTIIGLNMHVKKFHAITNLNPPIDKKNNTQKSCKKNVPNSDLETKSKSVLQAAPKVEPKLGTNIEPKLVAKLVAKVKPKLVTKTLPKAESKSIQKAVQESISVCVSRSGQNATSTSESEMEPNHDPSKNSPETLNAIIDVNQSLENEDKKKARFVLPRPKKGQWIVRVEKIRITRM